MTLARGTAISTGKSICVSDHAKVVFDVTRESRGHPLTSKLYGSLEGRTEMAFPVFRSSAFCSHENLVRSLCVALCIVSAVLVSCELDRYGSDSCSESDDEGDDYTGEGMAIMDVEDGNNKGGTPAEGSDGRLTTAQASRLLVLMAHARTCPGQHAKPQHAEVCRSIKFLMLHIRDCTG